MYSQLLWIRICFSYWYGAVFEIYLDRKFQWLQEGLNCESLAYKVVSEPTRSLFLTHLFLARKHHQIA